MSLANRLNAMERRIAKLEQWADAVQQAVDEEEAAEENKPELTLDGERTGSERDQNESLG